MNKQEIEIKEVGSYFQIDNDGFLVNPASLDKIQDEWKPMINEVVEVYKKQFGNNLKNVYIRGSVAKGEAIKNISDLDTFAYVDLEKEDIVKNWAKDDAINLKNKYPFVEHFEFVAKPLSSFLENKLILNQSVSVYGESLNVPKVKIGKEL